MIIERAVGYFKKCILANNLKPRPCTGTHVFCVGVTHVPSMCFLKWLQCRVTGRTALKFCIAYLWGVLCATSGLFFGQG